MKIAFTLTWKKLVALAVAGVLGALVVGWSGFVSIAASSGHFAPVSWFLHWTMRNAVVTQATGIEVPSDIDLDDPALVQRAAGHFATDCAFCHGAPGVEQSPVTQAMMPPPPRLERQVGRWRDRELFWIGQHGIKYSGMPAWVTQERPDEVWAMVAFLRALPALSPDRFADMALGGSAPRPIPRPGDAVSALADCARCHGESGRGAADAAGPAADAVPIIAGQPEAYLLATLRAFASGTRHSGYMQGPAKRYDDAVLAELARHYAAQPAGGPEGGIAAAGPDGGTAAAGIETSAALPAPAEPGSALARTRTALARTVPDAAAYGAPYDQAGLVDLGRRIAMEGLPERKLPSCDSCHGRGAEVARYPYLAGQPAWYTATHLELWREDKRGGTADAHLMDKIAIHLTDEQIAAVSAWYASLPAGR